VPRGFAKDHPAADYLQYRQFMAFPRGAGGVRDEEGFLQAACATRSRRSRRWCGF
jgi:hypothetical protein